ncbi:PaaI family thioesterase [Pseudonocardia halophobica]|uniref:PaaI family thioesterase n=1 Tax=Pseudonocardia halophobica TaxID=29401 RepID=UPI003D8DAE47
MAERTGPFWDGVEGRAPKPRAAQTLGLEVVAVDPEAGTIELSFEAVEDWTNPAGNVLGAFVAAMLYDVVGPALLATLEPDEFQSTLELGVHFLRPVRPGRLTGRGRVAHRRGDLAHLEGSLHDPDGATVATATATARVIPLAEARDAV